MTKIRISFAAALGFLAAGLVAAAPASAGSLNVAKPTVTADRHADLHHVDRGSWKKKKYFKSKKHRRGSHYYGGNHYDDYYRYGKKKKHRRAYRKGYDQGYYEGRRSGYYDGHRPRYRSRGRHHRHRFGSGFIKTPGFYFRF